MQPNKTLGVRKWLAVNPHGEVRSSVGLGSHGCLARAGCWCCRRFEQLACTHERAIVAGGRASGVVYTSTFVNAS